VLHDVARQPALGRRQAGRAAERGERAQLLVVERRERDPHGEERVRRRPQEHVAVRPAGRHDPAVAGGPDEIAHAPEERADDLVVDEVVEQDRRAGVAAQGADGGVQPQGPGRAGPGRRRARRRERGPDQLEQLERRPGERGVDAGDRAALPLELAGEPVEHRGLARAAVPEEQDAARPPGRREAALEVAAGDVRACIAAVELDRGLAKRHDS
jgi:hypothetical protein